MAGFDNPANGVLFATLPHLDARQACAFGRASGQPDREALNPRTPARERDGELPQPENPPCTDGPELWQGVYIDLMTGDRATSFPQRTSKDVPQFAPNFTVYVLPPDVVCLYSEHRKFFLHGELYCALASAIAEGGRSFRELVRELERDFPSDKIQEALKRLVDRRYVVRTSRSSAGTAAAYWASLGLLPEIAEKNLQKCRVRIQAIDVQGASELGDALAGLGVRVVKRSPDLTVTLGERLSRGAAGRIEPAAFVRPDAVAARAALRYFSPGRADVQPGQGRMLDVSCRADEAEPRGQGAARARRRPLRRGFAAGTEHVRTKRHPARIRRDRESDRHRLSYGITRSHRQPRSVGLDHREALRGGPPAMSGLRPQGVARPAPRAGAGRACRRRQAHHDQRRIPDRFVAGHGGAFPQVCEPAYRRGLASRTDRSRSALEHQLPCHAQFFAAGADGQRPQGGTGRRQLRQGQHRRAGRSQRADGGDRALYRDLSGRRDQSDTAVYRFSVGRGHSSEQGPAVQRRAIPARPGADLRPRRTAAADPIRSIGRDRMVAGLVAARQALQISADHAVVFFLPGPRRLPGGFQRLRRRQHARGSHRPGVPRAGGTRCLCNLVVQSIAAAASRPQPVRRFLHPRCANPVCRNRTPALGARRHQRSRHSDLRRDNALDAKRAGKYRVRFRRALRSANRGIAGADGAEPIHVHRFPRRRHRGKIEP